jgi:hypothetical protein
MIYRFITVRSSVSDLQRCYDEINMDLQQIHEWAMANGLKVNPEKSQVILIHRCRADIPPPTLLGDNVVKVVSRVRNLGFVLNERLTGTDHFRKVFQKIYWILRSLGPHAAHTSFEVRRRLVLSLILPHVNYGNIVFTGADSASQRRLGIAFKACLRYIHMKRRLDHVSHLESTVTGTVLVDNASIQLLLFLYKILYVRHPSYLFSLFHFASSARTRNLTVPPHRTLAMSQSFVVLGCRAWNSLPHDVKRLLTHWRFVSAFRGMYRSP